SIVNQILKLAKSAKGLIASTIASCFSLCFFGIGIVLKRIEVGKPIPFGPFISLGAMCYVLAAYSN
ncbi:prepilin peptidase, partial [Bacillus sp. HC-Mk]